MKDPLSDEEAQKILSQLDPGYIQSLLPAPRKEEGQLKVVTAELGLGI